MKKLLLYPIHVLTGLFLFTVAAVSPFVLLFAIVYYLSDKGIALSICRKALAIAVIIWAAQYFYKLGKDFWKDEVL